MRAGEAQIAISTAGNFGNVLLVIESCRSLGIHTIGFVDRYGSELAALVDLPIVVAHKTTARIQEAHMFLGHQRCHMIEALLGLGDKAVYV